MTGFSTITEQVIAQVKSRPVLWDKNDEMYGNIQAMDYEWIKMSAVLKRDKEFIKKRWRRVRDVFRIEIKKLNVPQNPSQPIKNYYTGVWPHFQSMLFLKDSLTKRTPRLFFPEENEDTNTLLTDSSLVQEEISEIEHLEEKLAEEQEEFNEKPMSVNVGSVWSLEQHSPDKEKEREKVRGVKRKAEDWGAVLDEDINFAKSIVGYLRKLNPIRKLMVRNEIQSILLRELLCDKCRCTGQQKACPCE